jgi:hypothetical protein
VLEENGKGIFVEILEKNQKLSFEIEVPGSVTSE